MNTQKTLLYAFVAGLIAGVLDVVLVYFAEPSASFWLLAQVFLAWITIGWAVIVSETGLRPIWHCLLVTLFLSFPWYIATAIIPGQWNHLVPLIIQSIIFGIIFTFIKKLLVKQITNA